MLLTMKKLLFVLCGVMFINPASASEIRNVITDSVQLTVNGSSSQSTRLASEYTVSGTNITATTLGGLSGAASEGTAAVLSAGDYEVTTGGAAFSFSETARIGADNIDSMSIDSTSGQAATHNTYGDLTTISGGTAGSLAGTLSSTTVPTITAGGQGTTAIGQRTIQLSVFD